MKLGPEDIDSHTPTLTFLLLAGSCQQLIKDVECAFISGLSDGAGLLQKIGLNIGTSNVTRVVKVDADKFALKENI